jgi:hypothetical protein
MRIAAVFLAAIFWLTATTAQEQRTPTVNQCRADREAWLLETYGRGTGPGAQHVSLHTLFDWDTEMGVCGLGVDEEQRAAYQNAQARFEIEVSRRRRDFIERHGLTQQFYKEDAAGER